MITHSYSGVSLTLVIFLFLSGIGGLSRCVTKCSHAVDVAKNAEKTKDVINGAKNSSRVSKLFHSNQLVEINERVKMKLPGIAERIDDTRGYDHAYAFNEQGDRFFIHAKSELKSEKSLFDQWVNFHKFVLATRVVKLFMVYD